jgi:sulfite reductase beta subunit
VDYVKKIFLAWAENANKHERMAEFINRIGWERFFELADLEFSWHLIDDFRIAPYFYASYRTSTQFRW